MPIRAEVILSVITGGRPLHRRAQPGEPGLEYCAMGLVYEAALLERPVRAAEGARRSGDPDARRVRLVGPRRLGIKVNGRTAGVLALPKSGGAPYRSAGQDSEYHVCPVVFDAGWLRAGMNEITLALQRAVPFANPDQARPGNIGAVMYEVLRLEVRDEAAHLAPDCQVAVQ